MPVTQTYFTFPETLEVNDDMTFDFMQGIDKYVYNRILKATKAKSIDSTLMNSIIQEIKKGKEHGEDDSPYLYAFISSIMENKNLRKIFKFTKLESDIDAEEGHDDHYYYQYRNTTAVINTCIYEIKKQIALLKTYDKKVIFEVE